MGESKKLLREPLLHFVVLGAVVFAIHGWRESHRTEPKDAAAGRIDVNEAMITRLKEGFTRQWHRAPEANELRGLVNDHVREEVLYREGIAMGLDRDDTIVRRRMAQKMEFLTQDIAAAVEADDTELQKYFEQNAARYAKAARVSFRHVFFSRDRRGAKLEADAREALAALAKGANDETLGDPFLREHEFTDASAEDVGAALGREFAEKVVSTPVGAWRGPVASSYGLHLVRVSGRSEPMPVAFEEVRDAVARDFADERRRAANEGALERLKAQYRITVDEAALKGAAAPFTKTATR